MAPASACSTPAAMPIRVDLPAPFSPTMAWTSPGVIRTSTPLRARTGPKLLRIPASVITGTCTVTPGSSLSGVLCMAQPPGNFRKRNAAEDDDRVGQVLGGPAEAECRDQLRQVSEKKGADHGCDHASFGQAAERVAADHHRGDGAEKIRQTAQHSRRNQIARKNK